jgi:limonene-1,2-epoxide hydrolase
MNLSPKQLIVQWVEAFNAGDVNVLASMYHEDAINHQVPNSLVKGRSQIVQMFEQEFAAATMLCIVEQILEDGNWGVLEWKDPSGLRGCGFFQVENNLIVLQRGYWDKLSFLKLNNLPLLTAG